MSVDGDITAALLARVDLLSDTYAIAYPGTEFIPTGGDPFLSVSVFPTGTEQVTVGMAGLNRYTGFLQISVFWPRGQGVIEAQNAASDIIGYFKRGTNLTSGVATVRIITPPIARAPLFDAGWLQIPITINWQSDNSNP